MELIVRSRARVRDEGSVTLYCEGGGRDGMRAM